MKDTEHMNEERQLALDKIADNDHEIYALLKQRYSPRVFADTKVTDSDLNRLFEAVRWSASSSNLQPWRFIYARNGTDSFDKIVSCLSDFNKKWAPEAPVLMLTAYKEKTDDGRDNFHALHDLGLSLGNMTVQAQYMSIALHHMAGVDWKKAHEVFDIPDGYHISTAVAIGYYGGPLDELSEELREQETAKRKRNPQGEFAFKDEWGQ
ncbi:nitroreductase family protein [Pricia sp. S334]|uniref:Nitroreductase family protein n=1 Tax=Pricia mediterranea TaxID=3076079 RepID=A0ABU3LBJ1_9FLAO|nr:nitroreductase family protein [Pricia sp. S334]MDT7830559.1 nitroreductase family protein [Pricia sp. S334]